MVDAFHENIASCACLNRSGLNDIFHWTDQTLITERSLFIALTKLTESWITEKIEVSSANSLTYTGHCLINHWFKLKIPRSLE